MGVRDRQGGGRDGDFVFLRRSNVWDHWGVAAVSSVMIYHMDNGQHKEPDQESCIV